MRRVLPKAAFFVIYKSQSNSPKNMQNRPRYTPKRDSEPKQETRRFVAAENKTYIAFFKPYGVLTQFTQPEDSDKEVLSSFGFPPHVYPLGRLDYDSEGLLILSDDARLNSALLDPSKGHRRVYLVQVEKVPTSEELKVFTRGIVIGNYKTRPARAELLECEPQLPPRAVPIRERKNIPTSWLKLTLTEGKNRQVRKMTAAVGYPTLRLVRSEIGGIKLDSLNLEPGQWRKLTQEEVAKLFER